MELMRSLIKNKNDFFLSLSEGMENCKMSGKNHGKSQGILKWILSTCPAKNQAGCIERVVHHSHENQKFYLFKIAINEKCQKPKLTVKVIMVAMATAV